MRRHIWKQYFRYSDSDSWLKFTTKNFQATKKYRQLVANFLHYLQETDANMCLKIHLIHLHLDSFPKNLQNVSDKRERRYQDLKYLDRNY